MRESSNGREAVRLVREIQLSWLFKALVRTGERRDPTFDMTMGGMVSITAVGMAESDPPADPVFWNGVVLSKRSLDEMERIRLRLNQPV